MNIVLLNYEYPPVGSGGGIISRYIAEGFALRGHQVTVFTTWFNGLAEVETVNNVKVIRVKSKRRNLYRSNPVEMLSWIKETKKATDRTEEIGTYDICVANFALPGGAVAKYLKERYNLKYVVISHGHDVPWVRPIEMYFYHALTFPWIRRILKKSELNFVQTVRMKANIDRFLGMDLSTKNIIVPNGYDPGLYYPDPSKRPDILSLLFVGRLTRQKNPFFMLHVVNELSAQGVEFTLRIAGDGPYRKRMEQFCTKAGIGGKVKFLGKVEEQLMPELYQSSHILLAPSISEGMSISHMEAVACGCYVLVNDVSGSNEIISDQSNGEILELNGTLWVERINAYSFEKFNKKSGSEDLSLYQLADAFPWNKVVALYEEKLIELLPIMQAV